MKVYLAGPEVFLADARAVGARKKALCARFGLEGLYPLDQEIDGAGLAPAELAARIYDGNLAMLEAADAVIANLTPFRGPNLDAGTAFEIGFALARGKAAFGYANVSALHAERVAASHGGRRASGSDGGPEDGSGSGSAAGPGRLVDADGHEIEDFGHFENLMISVPLWRRAGRLFCREVPAARRLADLGAFEDCLRFAAGELGAAPEQRTGTETSGSDV